MATEAEIAQCCSDVAKLFRGRAPLSDHEKAAIQYYCAKEFNQWIIFGFIAMPRRKAREVKAVLTKFPDGLSEPQSKELMKQIDLLTPQDEIVVKLTSMAPPKIVAGKRSAKTL